MSGANQEGVLDVVKANNEFALDLYSNLRGEAGNLFYSPWSIFAALAMTYEGARGQTAEEMQGVFHFPESDVLRPAYKQLHDDLNPKSAAYKLSTANALWAEQTYPFLKEYIELVQEYYAGRVTNLDFIHQSEAARKTINRWVEEQTNDKIKDILSPGALNYMTRLVLTNAIYFKGNWLSQFDEANTKDEDLQRKLSDFN